MKAFLYKILKNYSKKTLQTFFTKKVTKTILQKIVRHFLQKLRKIKKKIEKKNLAYNSLISSHEQ